MQFFIKTMNGVAVEGACHNGLPESSGDVAFGQLFPWSDEDLFRVADFNDLS